MSRPPPNVLVGILSEIESLLAQIGLPLAVEPKTWGRWKNNLHKPSPDAVSRAFRDIWTKTESPDRRNVRDSVLAVIRRRLPLAPVESWKSAVDFGAHFFDMAKDPHADAEKTAGLSQKSTAGPAISQSDPHNPFTWLDAIGDPDAFFGREKELRNLRDYIRTRSNVQIVGPRRMGKSSLLLAVGHRVKDWIEQPAFAFVDMEMANCHTVKGWLRCVAREWNWPKPPENLADFADRVQAELRARRRLVLCLDEFEKFKDLAGEFTIDFFENLRGCGQAGVSILTAARMSLREIRKSGALLSPYYNTFARLDLGPFTDLEARAFVSLARTAVPEFTEDESAAILKSAKGHPLRLVFACHDVLEAKRNGETLFDAVRQAERRADEILPPPA